MSVAEEDESVAEEDETELKKTKYPHLRSLTGGKGPVDPPSEGWLKDYVPGTSFVARERNSKNVDYNLYHVIFNRPDVTLLKWELPDGKLLDYYVDPERFSTRFIDPVILGVVNLEEVYKTPEDVEDGNEQRNRPDPT